MLVRSNKKRLQTYWTVVFQHSIYFAYWISYYIVRFISKETEWRFTVVINTHRHWLEEGQWIIRLILIFHTYSGRTEEVSIFNYLWGVYYQTLRGYSKYKVLHFIMFSLWRWVISAFVTSEYQNMKTCQASYTSCKMLQIPVCGQNVLCNATEVLP